MVGQAQYMSGTLGNVRAQQAGGYFARFGTPPPQARGEHAGVDLGTQQLGAAEGTAAQNDGDADQ